jgi:hypothetical protein
MHRLREISHEVGENAQALAQSLESAACEMETLFRERIEMHPLGMLAAALGIGYVLGRGLPSRLTSLLFSAGSRVALAAVARELMKRPLSESGDPEDGAKNPYERMEDSIRKSANIEN